MTDSNDRDFIGEVIAEDNAKREVLRWQLKGFIPGVEGLSKGVLKPWVVMADDYDELRQQLADVSAERDRFSRMYDSAVGALCAIGEALGVDEDDQSTDASIEAVQWLKISINDLKLRLNASEARESKMRNALEAILPFVPTSSAREGGPMKYSANVAAADLVRDALAQSEPATEASGKVFEARTLKSSRAPKGLRPDQIVEAHGGGSQQVDRVDRTDWRHVEKWRIADAEAAKDEQGTDAYKVNNRQMGLVQFVEKHPVEQMGNCPLCTHDRIVCTCQVKP